MFSRRYSEGCQVEVALDCEGLSGGTWAGQ